ncbi:MAG: DUF3307 domain-containing protein [Caldilineaceae bacterium]|nr:DUF3307 domain-containing protein [Caldilineaceae bacterium]MCB9150085.1 DUF3307 domain-containing protein [Caldilineaceae bacterium]
MNLFTWLFLGHLIGDWVLQNDWMAQNKQSALLNLSCATHCAIYTLTLTVTLWFSRSITYTSVQISLFFILTFLSHYLIDATNAAAGWSRLFQQSNSIFVRIVVDQTFHLMIIAVLIEFLLV